MDYLVKFKLKGRPYGMYPDAHAMLSLLYSNGYITDVNVSGLLPVVDSEPYFPVGTQLLGESVGDKELRAIIKSGRIFAPQDIAISERIDANASLVYLEYTPVPRNAVDRVTSTTNLYFEQSWMLLLVQGDKKIPVSEFGFVISGDVDPEHLTATLFGASIGANKSHGAVIVEPDIVELDAPIGTSGGVLLSLALPSDRPPRNMPVVYEKWVFYRAKGVVYRKSFGVYGMGSYLKDGEYIGGDVDVGEDDRGFTARLFVRPLFLEVD